MGGLIVAVRLSLLHRCTAIVPHPVVPGRVLRLLLDGPELALQFINVHLDTSMPQTAQHSLLNRIFTLRDPSLDFLRILAGDFNFTFPGDCRLRLSDTRQLTSDDPLGAWFSEHSDPLRRSTMMASRAWASMFNLMAHGPLPSSVPLTTS